MAFAALAVISALPGPAPGISDIGGIKLDLRTDSVRASKRQGHEQYFVDGQARLRPYWYIDFNTDTFKRTLRYHPERTSVGIIFDGHEMSLQNFPITGTVQVRAGGQVLGRDRSESFTYSGNEDSGRAGFVWTDGVAEITSVYTVFPGDPAVYLHLKIVPTDEYESEPITLLAGINPNGVGGGDPEPMIVEGEHGTVRLAQGLRRNNLHLETGTGSLLVKRPGKAKIMGWSGAAGYVFDPKTVAGINQVGYHTLEVRLKDGVREVSLALMDFYRPDEFSDAISEEFYALFNQQTAVVRKTFASGKHR